MQQNPMTGAEVAGADLDADGKLINQTASSYLCNLETKYSFLYKMTLHRPCERSLKILLFLPEFAPLLIYPKAAKSESMLIVSPALRLSSVSLGNSVNSSFEYFLFSCV